jgi:serine/threonine protein kinase
MCAERAGELTPGSLLGGYRIEQRIGRGGMAMVYRASDERAHRTVALKVLAAGLTRDHVFRTRFAREAAAAAAVDHPGILPVHETGESSGRLFIAMRYVPGGDVRSLLRGQGPLPASLALDVATQAAAALDAAHARGVVHRDVKPANLLLEASYPGTPTAPEPLGPVYLTDFGISKSITADHLTAVGQIVGTLDYAAPEQLDGEPVDGRTDQYALACTAYELLAGSPPFRGSVPQATIYGHLAQDPPSLADRRNDLAPAADQVIARALAKDPADRYATCSQFATHLGLALGLVKPTRPATPPGRPSRRTEPEPPTTLRDPA